MDEHLKFTQTMRRMIQVAGETIETAMRHILLFLLLIVSERTLLAQDEIEFLSGTKITGQVTQIDKAGKKVTFVAKIGTRTSSRTYVFSQIHSVLYRGKQYVLNAKPADVAQGSGQRLERSREEVQDIIDSVGPTAPAWLASVRLNYPRTLDLSWPDSPNKVWQNQNYPGQYVWDVINPNPHRWREGVKLMHHIIDQNGNNQEAQVKSMNQLGTLYAGFLEDWPRAAYWWQQAGEGTPGAAGAGGFRVGYEVGLAKCYYRLGNKQMAVDVLNRTGGTPPIWCELGEHDRALQEAEKARHGWMKEKALIVCGDVCRHAGWYDKALDYYTQATRLPNNDKYKHMIPQARERIAALRAVQSIDLNQMPDGRYSGQAVGYSGTLHVSVSLRQHRIGAVQVTRHVEKQYYSALTDVPRQIVQNQGVEGVDATSGATITAEAIVRASARALAK